MALPEGHNPGRGDEIERAFAANAMKRTPFILGVSSPYQEELAPKPMSIRMFFDVVRGIVLPVKEGMSIVRLSLPDSQDLVSVAYSIIPKTLTVFAAVSTKTSVDSDLTEHRDTLNREFMYDSYTAQIVAGLAGITHENKLTSKAEQLNAVDSDPSPTDELDETVIEATEQEVKEGIKKLGLLRIKYKI